MPYEYFWYAPTGELIEHQQQGNAGFNTPFQFSARTYDAIPELVYMGARYYSPQFSIFTSPDPMRAYRSWISPYNYVQNNPVMRQDPTGMLDGGVLEEGIPGEPIKAEGYEIKWNGKRYFIEKDGVKYYWSETLWSYISDDQETILPSEPFLLSEVTTTNSYMPKPEESIPEGFNFRFNDPISFKDEPHLRIALDVSIGSKFQTEQTFLGFGQKIEVGISKPLITVELLVNGDSQALNITFKNDSKFDMVIGGKAVAVGGEVKLTSEISEADIALILKGDLFGMSMNVDVLNDKSEPISNYSILGFAFNLPQHQAKFSVTLKNVSFQGHGLGTEPVDGYKAANGQIKGQIHDRI